MNYIYRLHSYLLKMTFPAFYTNLGRTGLGLAEQIVKKNHSLLTSKLWII